jgi:hypothetical protein
LIKGTSCNRAKKEENKENKEEYIDPRWDKLKQPLTDKYSKMAHPKRKSQNKKR